MDGRFNQAYRQADKLQLNDKIYPQVEEKTVHVARSV